MLREGFNHLSAGRFNEAGACCRRLLEAKPDLVEAHFRAQLGDAGGVGPLAEHNLGGVAGDQVHHEEDGQRDTQQGGQGPEQPFG